MHNHVHNNIHKLYPQYLIMFLLKRYPAMFDSSCVGTLFGFLHSCRPSHLGDFVDEYEGGIEEQSFMK